jgi:hypothetical protein
MANRYWVGGTGTWDNTAGTKWSATSGGSGGASVPTAADDVFFNASSGTGTVTVNLSVVAKTINCTGFTGTITGTGTITVSGSMTLSSGMTYTQSGTVVLNGTGTLTTAGKTFSAVQINGSGITVTLGGTLNTGSNRAVTVINGTFATANFNVTASRFIIAGPGNTRVVNLGSSTLSLSVDFTCSVDPTNLTFDAGTSQINITSSTSGELNLGTSSLTFYNVSFTGTGTGVRAIRDSGVHTFNDLTFTAPVASAVTEINLYTDITVSGTLTCSGASSFRRLFVNAVPISAPRTITAAALSAADCDFRDITIAGAAAGTAPTRAGDCGGNSGVTFPAPKNVYRVGANTSWIGSASWALTSNGTGDNNNFPLAQDTAIIDNVATAGSIALGIAYNMPSLDCSTRTNSITLNHNIFSRWHGSYILGSGVTISGTSDQQFFGRGTMTLTSAGKSITFPINMRGAGGVLIISDAISVSLGITVESGTFDANNQNVTCATFISTNSFTRTITMGSGLWTLSGTGTVWNTGTITGLTLNVGTANILLSNTTTTARTFSGGGVSLNKLTIGGATGTSTTTISGVSLTELASTKIVAHTVNMALNVGTIGKWSITGTVGNVVTVKTNIAATRRSFTLTTPTAGIDYLSVTDIEELSGNKFYVGSNSTDGGNNVNVYFTSPPSVGNGLFFGSNF